MQHAGIDVSAKFLTVCFAAACGKRETFTIDNTAQGHQKLVRRLTGKRLITRVALEASGNYGLDVTLTLAAAEGIELMVVNPRVARDFARAHCGRSKTDAVDAEVLLEYVQRMAFVPYQPPSPELLELRCQTRRISELTEERAAQKARLHAAELSKAARSQVVVRDLKVHIRFLNQRIAALEKQALALIRRHRALDQNFRLICTAPGFATKSALRLLGELCVLPADMSDRQWVAYAGLDPAHYQSGSSVHKPARISRRGHAGLRAILFLSAMCASTHNAHVRTYYQQLCQRGKKPLQALVAVMRKLLHAIHGMLKNRTPFEGAKFRQLAPATP